MVMAGPQRILLLCLLHFCTSVVGEAMHPAILMEIVKNFENQLKGYGQYAVAFRVEKKNCLKPNYDGRGLITHGVKKALQKNEVYVSDNLIAARPNKDVQEHSEFLLKDDLNNILNVKNQCVVYFTVNSPCLDKCISEKSELSIKSDLRKLQKYEGIKAFAFKLIWKDDKKPNVIDRLKKIAPLLPCYQCEETNAPCVRLYKKKKARQHFPRT